MKEPIADIETTRVQGQSRGKTGEKIATESKLKLYVDDEHIIDFIYSAGLEEQLAIGYLLSAGILPSKEWVENIDWSQDQECKVRTKQEKVAFLKRNAAQLSLTHNNLLKVRDVLIENQEHHKTTRGFHGASITEITSGRWFTCEDIGRHNAVDKVIGYGSEENYNLSECMVLLSGRLLSNVVSKCSNAGIPLIASMTVATDEGIQIAKESDMTIIGSLSEDGFWLYNEGVVKIRTG